MDGDEVIDPMLADDEEDETSLDPGILDGLGEDGEAGDEELPA